MQQIELSKIERDGSTQARLQLNLITCGEYAEALGAGESFPPVTLFFDGDRYWIGDGFHRVTAAQMAGLTSITAEVRTGAKRDATLHAVSANADHGLRRTNDDKRNAVRLLLSDPEWSEWSDREIARRCRVTHPFVAKRRTELSGNGYQIAIAPVRKVARNGTTYSMDTGNVGAAKFNGSGQLAHPVEDKRIETPAAPPPGRFIMGDARGLNLAQLGGKPFKAIIADPPWEFRMWSVKGAAKTEYSLLTIQDIRRLPVGELAADDCVLFLWATNPLLPEALETIAAWGFTYVTKFPWIKTTTKNQQIVYANGFWVRGASEDIMIATRGKVSAPRMEGFLGLIGPRIEHSRKPQDVHTFAEATTPGPYLELFARYNRPGWVCFGNENRGPQPADPAPIRRPPWLKMGGALSQAQAKSDQNRTNVL